MMSEQQSVELEKLITEFQNNKEKYANWNSSEICNFSVYELQDENEYRLVVGMITIERINENMAGVHTSKRYYAIFPNGSMVDMLSSFKNDTNKVYEYLKKFNKII
jgi:NADH:ubiquinone oxidoreductase subunit F (NADH-binding)